jgi:hypothetical protein
MKWVLVALAAMLAGCATYSDLKERPADFTGSTSKSPQAYLECVVPKWTDEYAGSHIITDGGGLVLIAPVGGGTPSVVAMTLTATSMDGGTRIEMKHLPSLSDFTDQWHQARSCL